MPITLDGTAGITTPAISGDAIATQAEAEAGTNNTKLMTPLRFRNGLNATGTAPTYACRAWVNFGVITGVVTLRASGNVTSITDNPGSGSYTVNFTTALPDTNYATAFAHASTAGSVNITSYNTTSITVETYNSSAVLTDRSTVCVSVFR